MVHAPMPYCAALTATVRGVSEVEKFLSGRDIRLSKDRINSGGGNYGELEVLDNLVRFSSENRCGVQ